MKTLLDYAKEAATHAYAPYSNFHVGAAVELTDGTIVTGSNQEVGSYSLAICAERVALSSAFHQYPTAKVKRIAIYSPNRPDGIPPCGACREYISECSLRSGIDIEIIGVKEGKVYTISELLPESFYL